MNTGYGYDATLNGQNETMIYVRRSYMYEFIILSIIAVIVLTITIRNLLSDTVTTGGYTICWIILILFIIATFVYFGNLVGSLQSSSANNGGSSSNGGPVIRIHYM